MRIKDIKPGERITFSSIDVVDPETGAPTARANVRATATGRVYRFQDGSLRRLFVDIDPQESGGFYSLWVEVEDDPAEDLFALVAERLGLEGDDEEE